MKKDRTLIIILAITVAAFVTLPFIGTTDVSINAIKDFKLETVQGKILYQIRLPRICAAFIAGAALSLCGMALQAMFKNPLATPFTLGISSGAALGTAIYIISALPAAIMGISTITVASFTGAIGACMLVYGLTRAAKGFSVATMLLAGVVVNFFFSSIILLLQYMSDFTESFRIIHWLMGSINVTGFKTVLNMLIFTAGGSVIIWRLRNELNLMTISDEIAITRGVNLQKIRKILLLSTSIMVAGVVAFCGPIGFVGLIAPHICRLLVGADHKRLAPASMLFGAAFLGICDTIARTIITDAEIPVGVVTALLGGPFFVWLLIKGESEKNLL